ncbi:MAG: glycoside hydrolase family 28 protein [Bryobacteraceae bacterium]|nr:glycoside hydrolase family 28 protein [Bryobacteraceae bacterium]
MSDRQGRRLFLSGAMAAGAGSGAAWAQTAPGAGGLLNVRDFGAAGNGREPDTAALQAAIDACAAKGGGTIWFPAGRYCSGGLFLRSNTHLYLDGGATLAGSARLEDYPVRIPKFRSYTDNYTERSLLYGEGIANAGIHGDGAIDGQGAAFQGPYKVRPYLIRIVSSKDISVTGVTIRDSPMWVQHYLDCEDVLIHGITVHSLVNHNNDGIDIDCCDRVTISDCNIRSGDDAIVLKSTAARPTRNVAITNCVLSSDCNAFKLGTESNGGFQDIVVSNCTMYDTRLSGIAIELVDGGALDGVYASNITMRDVKNPLFIRLGNRARPFQEGGSAPGVGALRNVSISGLKATGAYEIGCPVSGIPGHFIENLSLENVRIHFTGGGKRVAGEIPENPDAYPEHRMFGALPAYGFFCRHVRNLRLRNVETFLEKPDERPAIVCDDVHELDMDGCRIRAAREAIRLRQVSDAFIHGCSAPEETAVFVDASAGGVKRLSLIGNDLGRAARAVEGKPQGLFLFANREKS